MATEQFVVAPGARIPFAHLSSREKQTLKTIITSSPVRTITRTPSGDFVSPLGTEKRVLWRRIDGSTAQILSIVDSSYKPE